MNKLTIKITTTSQSNTRKFRVINAGMPNLRCTTDDKLYGEIVPNGESVIIDAFSDDFLRGMSAITMMLPGYIAELPIQYTYFFAPSDDLNKAVFSITHSISRENGLHSLNIATYLGTGVSLTSFLFNNVDPRVVDPMKTLLNTLKITAGLKDASGQVIKVAEKQLT